MSYQLKVIKDNPIGFWLLDETSGSTAADYSGCGNNGTYSGGITNNLLPLIPGGTQGTLITNTKSVSFPVTKDYYGSTAGGGIADKYSTDNDFSLEVWFYPNITTTNETAIFADTTNNIGLYYNKGNIVFKIGGQEITYTIPYTKKALYIVAVYTVNNLKLYCDGFIVNSKTLTDDISLTNSFTTFSAGPTQNASDKFIIDVPAVYRYSLSQEQIYNHFVFGQPINVSQVAVPEEGIFFALNNQNIKKAYFYSYPINKSWDQFVNSDIYYNQIDKSISILPTDTATAKTVIFTDYLTVPTNIGLTYSKIEWDGEYGITVESSVDGSTYTSCENGKSLPQYQYGSFNSTGNIYLRFTLNTNDASKYIPKLKTLTISFYKTDKLYSDNFGDSLTNLNGQYFLGEKNYNILSRDYRNGLRCLQNKGFTLTTSQLINTVEFFYTPLNLNTSGLISSISGTSYYASNYSWNGSGVISKTNVSAIYINGVDKTSATNISSIFLAGEMYHIVIVYSSPISADLKFNYSASGSSEAIYKNICLYKTAFTSNQALNHFNLYVQKAAEKILDSSTITVTEQEPFIYNNEWVLVQSS